MSRRRDWKYDHTDICRVGTMMCITCGKEIEKGEYRHFYTEKGGYHPQHKACAVHNDPGWRAQENDNMRLIGRLKAKLAAYRDFREQWSEELLDEEIEWMQERIKTLEKRYENTTT